MKYIILNISDSYKHWSKAIDEYTKRLGKDVVIENIKPVKNWTNEQIIQKETDIILENLEKKYQDRNKVLLIKSWEQYSTEEFGKFLWYKKTVFIIWWPYGLDEDRITKEWVKKVSFGKITLPHWLAKLTLLEQIYRIWTIESGKKYHY